MFLAQGPQMSELPGKKKKKKSCFLVLNLFFDHTRALFQFLMFFRKLLQTQNCLHPLVFFGKVEQLFFLVTFYLYIFLSIKLCLFFKGPL